MSDINTLIEVNISKNTAVASQPGFGVYGIIAKFPAEKSVRATLPFATPFPRSRTYTSSEAMVADGFVTQDAVVRAATRYFQQRPRPQKVLIGRWDPDDDASLADGLNAIQQENPDWYGMSIVGITSATITLSTALITGNVVNSTIDGIAIAPITFSSDHASTMATWKTAIETALPLADVTVVGNTITVSEEGRDINVVTCVVTAGVSRPTAAITYAADNVVMQAAADWAQGHVKQYIAQDSAAALYNSGSTTDIAAHCKANLFDQTAVWYTSKPDSYIMAAVAGVLLPSTPGKLTVADKQLIGVVADNLTSAQEEAIWAKKANTYTVTGGLSLTNNGTTASGDYMDTIRNIAWLKSKIQVTALTNIANIDSVPFDDPGIVLVSSWLESDMDLAETNGVLIAGSTEVTRPKFADLDPADIAARTLKGISATAKIKNSVQRVKFDITLSN